MPTCALAMTGPTLKGLRKDLRSNGFVYSRTLSEFTRLCHPRFPGRCPGLGFANAFGVHANHPRAFVKKYQYHALRPDQTRPR